MLHDSAATLQARHYISSMHPESLAKMTLTKVKTHIIGWPEQTHTTHNTHTQRMPGILSGALHGKHFAALYPRTVADRAAHWPAYAKHAAAKPTCLPPALFIGFFCVWLLCCRCMQRLKCGQKTRQCISHTRYANQLCVLSE